MNYQQPDMNDIETEEQATVFGLFAEQLLPLPTSDALLSSLENRLSNRIQASIASQAGLRTVRSREGAWRGLLTGIRYKPLWEGKQGNSVLIEFAPGASLPVHRHNYLEEGIVLSGGLQLDDQDLNPFDYHVSPAGSHHGRISSRQGAVAYLRGSSMGQPMAMAKEVLGSLLPHGGSESQTIHITEGDWVEVQAGVYRKDLWHDGTFVSRLCRIDPNTYIEGHYHPLDEECMMLSGDLFLNDILLQAGDYQLAASGSEHLEIFSDTGALLFVRGAAP
jgi:quercetin dioxygenase-like cupin family protein